MRKKASMCGGGALTLRGRDHSMSTHMPVEGMMPMSRKAGKRERTVSINDGYRGEAVLADRVTHLNSRKPKLIQGLKKLY